MWKGGPCGPSATVHRHWPPLGWLRTTSRFEFDGSASSLSKEKKRTGKNDRASLKPSFPPLFPGSVLCLKLNFCFLPKRMMERGKKKKKSHPGLKSGCFLQLTSCLGQEGSPVSSTHPWPPGSMQMRSCFHVCPSEALK